MEIKLNDTLYDQCIRSLQGLIQIPSVKEAATKDDPFGRPVGVALDYFLEEAVRLGLPARNLDRYAGIVEIGHGDEELGILAHLDVVPAGDLEQWNEDPFSGTVKDGCIWGRGTLDDKGPAMAVLYAMKWIHELSLPLNKRVRLIIGTDEESTWKDIEYYKQKEKPPTIAFTPDGCFPVTNSEKGILTLRFQKKLDMPTVVKMVESGERHNVTPGTATAVVTFDKGGILLSGTESVSVKETSFGSWTIKAAGVEGRTSSPDISNNAIHVLINYLKGILPKEDGFWEAIDFYSDCLEDTNGRGINLNLYDDISGDLTMAPCIFHMDEDKVSFVSNIRYPSTYSFEEVENRYRSILNQTTFEWELVEHKHGIYFDKESPFIQSLLTVYKDYFNTDAEPLSISGGTYARAFPNTVAFGALIPGMPLNAHEPNEYVELSAIRHWIHIYAKAIYALAVEKEE